MTAPYPTWQTPAELAAELRPDADPETRTRWMERLMAEKKVPSIKVGRKRYFTPACREQMEREQLNLAEREDEWAVVGRKTKRGAA